MYKYCQLWKVFKRFLHDGTCHNFMHAMIRDGQIHNRSCQQSSPSRTRPFLKGVHKLFQTRKYGCPRGIFSHPLGKGAIWNDNFLKFMHAIIRDGQMHRCTTDHVSKVPLLAQNLFERASINHVEFANMAAPGGILSHPLEWQILELTIIWNENIVSKVPLAYS